ncbi:unnamed protein product [Prunus armeniaca]
MSAEALQVAKVYRHLLRAVKRRQGEEFQRILCTITRYGCNSLLCLIKVFFFLQIDLLFSYNIAVDRSDEMKKVLGKSAASVGLQLPERKENQQLIWIGQPHSIPRQSRSSLTADTTDTCTTFYRLIHHWSSRKKLMGTTNWHWQLLREEPDHNADG